jgi:very-short-patch-repair endonuclease
MDARQAMFRLGGVATRRELLTLVTPEELRRALQADDVRRVGRGRYTLSFLDEAVQVAHGMSGVVSHLSAALLHGWAVKEVPARPVVTVPRNRKLPRECREKADPRWGVLAPDEVDGAVTTRERTFVDCARSLPFDEGLAVADSALRSGMRKAQLVTAAESVRGPGRRKCLRVAHAADGRAANPFESVLRATVLDVKGLRVEPQHEIADGDFYARVDLGDPGRRLVLEAEGFEWHGDRKALMRDCRRYTGLVLRGWIVLRFSWEDVMLDPERVRDCLVRVLAVRPPRLLPPHGRSDGREQPSV